MGQIVEFFQRSAYVFYGYTMMVTYAVFPLMLAFALSVRSEILLVTRGDVAARAACEESARLSRAAGAHWAAAQSLRGLARIAVGDLRRFRPGSSSTGLPITRP